MRAIILSFLFIFSAGLMNNAMSYGNICDTNCPIFKQTCNSAGGIVGTIDSKPSSWGNQYMLSFKCHCSVDIPINDEWILVPNGC